MENKNKQTESKHGFLSNLIRFIKYANNHEMQRSYDIFASYSKLSNSFDMYTYCTEIQIHFHLCIIIIMINYVKKKRIL